MRNPGTPLTLTLARLLATGVAAAALVGAGCDAQSAHDVQKDNPLGPSFWIIPVPSDDDSLLGRMFATPPDATRTLEEQSSPNPCADKLQERREAQMPNRFENAVSTSTSANAGAMLSLYGFSAEVGKATHLLYKLDTTSKITRMDTAEYVECCREKGCGWGYVASLVMGEGEYAAGTEATATVQGNYLVASGGASRSYSVSNKRSVKGYIAAIIVEHARADAAQNCPPDRVWAKIECVPRDMPAQQEVLCRDGNPQSTDSKWKDNAEMQEMFRQQKADACRWIAIHGGPGTSVASLDPPPAASSATPGTPPPPAEAPPAPVFEAGTYVAINSHWSGKMTFSADGTFSRDNGDTGVWIFEGKTLRLKWKDGTEDELDLTGPGAFQNFTGFFRLKRTGPAPGAASPAPASSAAP